MKDKRLIGKIGVLALLVLAGNATEARASYLDPGTGSFILQFAIAGLLSGLYMAKSYFARLKSALKRLFTRQKPASP